VSGVSVSGTGMYGNQLQRHWYAWHQS
jgi:hypothetical protein